MIKSIIFKITKDTNQESLTIIHVTRISKQDTNQIACLHPAQTKPNFTCKLAIYYDSFLWPIEK